MRHLPKPLLLFCLGLPHLSSEIKAPHQSRRYIKNHESIINNTGIFIRNANEEDPLIDDKSNKARSKPPKAPLQPEVSSSSKFSPTQDPDISTAPHTLMEAWKKNLQKKLEKAIVERHRAKEEENQKRATSDPGDFIPHPTVTQSRDTAELVFTNDFPWLTLNTSEDNIPAKSKELKYQVKNVIDTSNKNDDNSDTSISKQELADHEAVTFSQESADDKNVITTQEVSDTSVSKQELPNHKAATFKQESADDKNVVAAQDVSVTGNILEDAMPKGDKATPLKSVLSAFHLPVHMKEPSSISSRRDTSEVNHNLDPFSTWLQKAIGNFAQLFTPHTKTQKHSEAVSSQNQFIESHNAQHNRKADPTNTIGYDQHFKTRNISKGQKQLDYAVDSIKSWIRNAKNNLKTFFSHQSKGHDNAVKNPSQDQFIISADEQQSKEVDPTNTIGYDQKFKTQSITKGQKQLDHAVDSIKSWIKNAKNNFKTFFPNQSKDHDNAVKGQSQDQFIISADEQQSKEADPTNTIGYDQHFKTQNITKGQKQLDHAVDSIKAWIENAKNNFKTFFSHQGKGYDNAVKGQSQDQFIISADKQQSKEVDPTNTIGYDQNFKTQNITFDSIKPRLTNAENNSNSNVDVSQQKNTSSPKTIGSVVNIESKEENSFSDLGHYELNHIKTKDLHTLELDDLITTKEYRIQLDIKASVLLSLDKHTSLSIKKVIDIHELLLSKGRVRIKLDEKAGLWTIRGRDLSLSLFPMTDIIVDMTGTLITRVFVIRGGCSCLPDSNKSPITITSGEHLSIGLSDFQRSSPSNETWAFLKQHLSFQKINRDQ